MFNIHKCAWRDYFNLIHCVLLNYKMYDVFWDNQLRRSIHFGYRIVCSCFLIDNIIPNFKATMDLSFNLSG